MQTNADSVRENVFFRRLSEAQSAEGSNGIHWSDLPISFGTALQCAHLDHCICGLYGLLEVLHANQGACEGGQSGLGGELTDRLFYASRALTASAKETLIAMQERIVSAQS
ncbi:hypothetical protein A7D16_17350 [Xanthomonas nasturtii]|uniref:hypothetical protein n=1 Tax=Xanthomonas nasturtii TaxID=1843581 RepID=UPI0007E3D00C|nr:hypothetical protein [Xanthomonas nasturtii]OAX87099.1 hypothetical protein A7D16_17350 [Xanthomonas nasturtii]WVL58834.1 hypothetical protein M3O54_020585 [Xanthomonas nasturtii]